MANRSTAPGRIALMGLVVAGALAGTAGTAGAQYYYYDDGYDPYPAYGYGYRYDYGYVPRPPRAVPRAPAPVPPYAVNRIAARDYGLVRIDRSIRREDTYVVDGVTARGQRLRLVLDAYAGDLIRRVPLRGPAVPAPDVVRADPREDHAAPRRRLAPQPPERPTELKPPAAASAPATTVPPSPAAPPAPAPAAPVEKPPAEASVPATAAPPQPARPAVPSPGASNPETGADKPRLVNPSDVRGTEAAERKPPLSSAPPTAEAPSIPPVQHVDPAPSTPRPETPIAPAAPLN